MCIGARAINVVLYGHLVLISHSCGGTYIVCLSCRRCMNMVKNLLLKYHQVIMFSHEGLIVAICALIMHRKYG
jgi:hypothetical protein